MNFFQLSSEDYLTFFAVLVRISVLVVVFPIMGERMVPSSVKILLSLALSLMLYPVLVSTGRLDPSAALQWGSTASGIASVIAIEAAFGLALGFTCRIIFDVVTIAGDIAGNLMGFAAASQFDPVQESQTQVISKFQSALAMLIFLVIDGHHVLMQGMVESFRIIGIGQAEIGGGFGERLIALTSQIIRVGMQLAAPMAISFFGIHVIYGVMAKALPQMNILVLSFSVSAFVGLFVLMISVPEFHDTTSNWLHLLGDQMIETMESLKGS